MGDFLKRNIFTVIILTGTLVLAGIAVFTAIRLYQLRNQPVAPNVPSSRPAAAEPACTLTFTITSETATPTPTPITEFACVAKGAYEPDGDGEFSVDQPLTSVMPGDEFYYQISYRNGGQTAVSGVVITDVLNDKLDFVSSPTSACSYAAATRTVTCTLTTTIAPNQTGAAVIKVKVKDNATGSIPNTANVTYTGDTQPSNCAVTLNISQNPTGTPTATPTATPLSCNGSCTKDSDCMSGLVCHFPSTSGTPASVGSCRNTSCRTETDCTCPGVTTTTTPEPELPEAGIGAPTLIGAFAGILLLLGAVLLAL